MVNKGLRNFIASISHNPDKFVFATQIIENTTTFDQDQCRSFIEQLGVLWSGTLHKDLEVWYFPDCEVVYYQASTALRAVRCVEFEATRKDSLGTALDTVERFERATGFEDASRSKLSLPQILFPDLGEMLVER